MFADELARGGRMPERILDAAGENALYTPAHIAAERRRGDDRAQRQRQPRAALPLLPQIGHQIEIAARIYETPSWINTPASNSPRSTAAAISQKSIGTRSPISGTDVRRAHRPSYAAPARRYVLSVQCRPCGAPCERAVAASQRRAAVEQLVTRTERRQQRRADLRYVAPAGQSAGIELSLYVVKLPRRTTVPQYRCANGSSHRT